MAAPAPYPLHYFVSRPYARKFFKDSSVYGHDINPRIAERLSSALLIPWAKSVGWGLTSGLQDISFISQELQGLLCWGDWALNGAKVFSFSAPLVQAFEHSDVADVSFSDVLPEGRASWYFHFGSALDTPIELSPGYALEGAYVISKPPESVRIVLCARAPKGATALEAVVERYDLRIPREALEDGAGVAFEKALATDIEDIQAAKLKLADSPEGLTSAEVLEKRMLQGASAYKQALSLVLNGLAYLKAYPADREEAWPADAPEKLASQAKSPSEKDRKRATSKLWELGFVPVQYIGQKFVRVAPEGAPGVKLHWRRGHWRNQAHGPAMSLRKLIWIQPTLVGAKDLDT